VNLTTTYDLFHFPSAGILRCSTIPPGQGCLLIAYQDIEAAAQGNAGHPPPGDSRSLQGSAFTFCLPRGGYWWLKLDRIPTPLSGNSTVKWEFIPTETEPGGSGGVFGPGNNLIDEGFSEVGNVAIVNVSGWVDINTPVLLFGSSRQAKYRAIEIQQVVSGSTFIYLNLGAKPDLSGAFGTWIFWRSMNLGLTAANANANRSFIEMFGPTLWRGEIWAVAASGLVVVNCTEGG
jgi:hypothetical protein